MARINIRLGKIRACFPATSCRDSVENGILERASRVESTTLLINIPLNPVSLSLVKQSWIGQCFIHRRIITTMDFVYGQWVYCGASSMIWRTESRWANAFVPCVYICVPRVEGNFILKLAKYNCRGKLYFCTNFAFYSIHPDARIVCVFVFSRAV